MKLIIIFANILSLTFAAIPFYNSILNNRIVNGRAAEPHQFPHQVGMFLRHPGNNISFCGGSLISNQWILTAAHCTESALEAFIFLGAHNITSKDENNTKFIIPRDKIINHWQYKLSKPENDIALLKLPKRIVFNDVIQKIDLPTLAQVNETFEGVQVISSGWGKTSDKLKDVSPILRYEEFPVITEKLCQNRYPFLIIKKSQICISGFGGKSPCRGDSGGPLVYTNRNGNKTLIGITSFGDKRGCELGYPGVFTRVTSFLNWISTNTGIKINN